MCPSMSAFVLFTALAGCASDGASKAAESYAHAMAPLLADDDALARSQVALAEGTTSGRLSAHGGHPSTVQVVWPRADRFPPASATGGSCVDPLS